MIMEDVASNVPVDMVRSFLKRVQMRPAKNGRFELELEQVPV